MICHPSPGRAPWDWPRRPRRRHSRRTATTRNTAAAVMRAEVRRYIRKGAIGRFEAKNEACCNENRDAERWTNLHGAVPFGYAPAIGVTRSQTKSFCPSSLIAVGPSLTWPKSINRRSRTFEPMRSRAARHSSVGEESGPRDRASELPGQTDLDLHAAVAIQRNGARLAGVNEG